MKFSYSTIFREFHCGQIWVNCDLVCPQYVSKDYDQLYKMHKAGGTPLAKLFFLYSIFNN